MTRFSFLVNDATDIQPTQTTALLIAAAIAQNHPVSIISVGDLSCHSNGQPWAQIRLVDPGKIEQKPGTEEFVHRVVEAIASTTPTLSPLADTDLLFIRTNPARDRPRAAAHSTALSLARRCQEQGVRVLNHPDGLVRAATKLYLLELPEFTRPQTLVSSNRDEIVDFIRQLNAAAVLKPLQGTRGNDVFWVASAQDKNLNAILDVILRQGLVMAQSCIPGAEAGDTRVVVFKGEVLTINGQAAAIQRVPRPGDFRSNLHAGGQAEPGIVTAGMAGAIAAIGPKLIQDGLFLVGMDFIGSQLVEINVFSTGGLRAAERFSGEDFSGKIIEALSHRA